MKKNNNKLNVVKLRMELARIDKSHAWLAKKLGYKTRQAFHLHIKNKDPRDVEKIGEILGCDPNELIVRI